ncbi:MAG: lipoate--protein ligase family protein [Rubripirellula sp.]|nr:lipoate--protein ligase family protein [Rubripirellula sp.]
MQQITDNFIDPADHLALDEALLLAADEGEIGESIRFWEFSAPAVVAGRSTRIDDEIDLQYCKRHAIPVLRRCSGGATVVGGPGCLMYSVVLSLAGDDSLRKIDIAHKFVMSRILAALQSQVIETEWQGICDLTWQNRKCSGNSLKISRNHLLYHGTILYGMELDTMVCALQFAPRQPDYRAGRDHRDFVTNLPIDPKQFSEDVKTAFQVTGSANCEFLKTRIGLLRQQRYDDPQWHFRH